LKNSLFSPKIILNRFKILNVLNCSIVIEISGQVIQRNMLENAIDYLKGIGPPRAEVLKKELSIFTMGDFLVHYPFRYIDKTRFVKIREISPETSEVLLKGILRRVESKGEGAAKRLTASLRDDSGVIELVWFRAVSWLEKSLIVGKEYVVFGKINEFNGSFSLPHPEMEEVTDENMASARTFDPVYPSTEKLAARGLDAKGIRRAMRNLLDNLKSHDVPDILPPSILAGFRLISRFEAMRKIHFPENQQDVDAATRRLKFEELFLLQLRLLNTRRTRKEATASWYFPKIGANFNGFYEKCLPFQLTGAQKRVIKEIRADFTVGKQMNRLVQGDVGSGKTVVALMSMLIALDNQRPDGFEGAGQPFQTCLMAPTEILAQQHFDGFSTLLEPLGIEVGYLTGSIKGKKRAAILEKLADGRLKILIGTHALIEEWVVFQNLGLVVIDEQHRFGVEQRAKLWRKSKPFPPHILVMTATPIPRTLAMTLYGDLDVSVIDELPPGRKPIETQHKNENHRLRVQGFMKEEIAKGRQIYCVYPMIEETEKLDLQNLMEGFESLSRDFPQPEFQIAILHGRMKSSEKDFEMARFVKKEAQIMVATTVIEVGVNVPNASVMIIENAERFGLSQLHQLRGRVGRGADQSFCILMTSFKLSADGRERINTMVETTDGFKISEVDLRLRGPGNIEGTQQSGLLSFRIADLSKDQNILQVARETAAKLLDEDPNFQKTEHAALAAYLVSMAHQAKVWGRIS
jgi:ATP-dependent DNA helicase RecG